jgi:hypothetical protein
MSDVFEQHQETLRQYQDSFESSTRQVGYCAAIDGNPVVFETFGTHHIFAAYWPKLLNGLALETLTSPAVLKRAIRPSPFSSDRIRDALSKSLVELFQSVGVGEDIRVTADGYHGSALIRDGHVEHWVMHWRTGL